MSLHVGLQIFMDKEEVYLYISIHFLKPHSSATAWQQKIKAKRLKGLMRDPIFAKVAFRLKRQRCEG